MSGFLLLKKNKIIRSPCRQQPVATWALDLSLQVSNDVSSDAPARRSGRVDAPKSPRIPRRPGRVIPHGTVTCPPQASARVVCRVVSPLSTLFISCPVPSAARTPSQLSFAHVLLLLVLGARTTHAAPLARARGQGGGSGG